MDKKPLIVVSLCAVVLLVLGSSIPVLAYPNQKVSISTLKDNSIKSLSDEPIINITIPEAHLFYHPLKFRYADVEFSEPGTVIDVNLSGFSTDYVYLGFTQYVYLHVGFQLISTWVVHNVAINDISNNFIGGGGTAIKIGLIDNWQADMGWGYFKLSTSNLGSFLFTISLTGVPPRLPFLFFFHALIDSFFINGAPFPSIPFPKIFGDTVTYQLDIHT